MATSITRATAIVFSLFVSGVVGGAWAGSAAADRAQDPYAELDTLVRVMDLVETTYVDEISSKDLVRFAIAGILEGLDPHSTWMSPESYRDLHQFTHGGTSGIGVELEVQEGVTRITRILAGSPASRDGLKVGDQIVAIDGAPLDANATDDPLMGPRGTNTTLRILRDGWDTPRAVQTMRDRIHPPNIEDGWAEPHIGYVRVLQFHEGVTRELEAAISRLQSTGDLQGLIIDVRDNPGGLLREAVGVADLFLNEGTIVSTWGRLEAERATHEATPGGISPSVRVALLVNGRSASASEILAGALQDTRRAPLIGTRTYGKGSVQTIFEHRDGSALKLTIGRYFTPSGEPVAPRDGRVPDVIVPWPAPTSPLARLRSAIGDAEMPGNTRQELHAMLDDMPKELIVQLRTIPWDDALEQRASNDPQLRQAIMNVRERLP